MSDYFLPEEILIEILVKLPVKSLIRGTSVCKQWRSLIRSPSFISNHLSNSETQALVRHYDENDNREHYTVIPKRGPFDINSDLEFEFPFKFQMRFFRIVGSCDGLVCLSCEISHSIIIWNPAIRNHVVLPQSKLANLYNESGNFVVLGFGVANNVYKVVRLVNCTKILEAQIFYLGGTGRWRRKRTGFNDVRVGPLRYLSCPIFFKGFVHWISYELIGENIRERNSISILTFHFGGEVFGEIVLPEELERVTEGGSASLSIMGESLGAIKYDREIGCNPTRCDVWMMKDYGVKDSWTKLYTIDCEYLNRVVGFWGSGEALVVVHGRGLVTYNPETKRIKHVRIKRTIHSLYVDDYKQSLILLGGGYSRDSGE